MPTTTLPQIGTPAQDSFARKIADACHIPVANAVNAALNVPAGSPILAALDKYAASLVIAYLLALAKTKGVQGFEGKGRRRKGGKRRDASPNSNPGPSPAASSPATGPGALLQDFTPAALAEELERRGIPAELALAKPDVVGCAWAILQAAARAVVTWEAAAGGNTSGDSAARMRELREAIENTGESVEGAAR